MSYHPARLLDYRTQQYRKRLQQHSTLLRAASEEHLGGMPFLVEGLDHSVLERRVDVARPLALAYPEDALDDAELRRCCIQACDGQPVVAHHAAAHDAAAAVA